MFTSTAKEQQMSRKESARSHLKDAGRNGKAAADDLDSAAHAVGKDVRDFIENAIDSASESLSQAKEKFSDTKETISQRISDKPLASAAILMGVGVLLGAFLRRR
jgi:ElaB/YqjD/DUF883 family membrane-anchored ribosome-binding protein